MNKIKVGIDATNIGGGGGITHLKEILNNYDQNLYKNDIELIIIFASTKVLDQLKDAPFIKKISYPELNGGLYKRLKFQLWHFDKQIEIHCDILFSLTGDYFGGFRPIVGMSRNMLLHERDIWKEIKQPKEILRFWLNYKKQKYCFKNAKSIIFISQYAKEYISKTINIENKEKAVIAHGVSAKFVDLVKVQKDISNYSFKLPFKFLYVSTIHTYKNHTQVIKAISNLRKLGHPVELTIVGGIIFKPAGKAMKETIFKVDSAGEFIHYKGHINYDEINHEYQKADGIIFASTCENMPNILIESMASGRAIACSNKQPMPEFLKEGGLYFDSKNSYSITNTLIKFLENPEIRECCIQQNKKEVKEYSWENTSRETFKFLIKTYKQIQNVQK
ncbi:glycosyltransferase family 4 protein [Salegentibacter sp. BDJ18]|uniref:glycosyltransferase family 4 protein n=1 Tax=Salegentibacter sp. BDJ18 TaxID=2816376 RepID=UPI001AAF5BF9|nr:glycosyltransferase family 1 protein [Salegentibacter sp. BDJ18]MBO2542863.1 glycosyltransferase family 4 protein [Salegentibacter sp. BDJ18]